MSAGLFAAIAGRAALGFVGAMLMPATLSLIRNIFPDPNRRRLAIGIGPPGSLEAPRWGRSLVDQLWWGAILLVAVPIMLPLLTLGPVFIPEFKDRSPGRVDMPSILLSLLTLAPVVYGIKHFVTEGPGPLALGPVALGFAMEVLLVRRQQRLPNPLLDMSLFQNSVFSTAIIANILALFPSTALYSSSPSTCSCWKA